jgi:hypothetical protein
MSESPPLAPVIPLRAIPQLPPPAGYLGVIQKTIEVDWARIAEHGPCVLVKPQSPARVAGLRNGDYVVSINDLPLDVFQDKPPPPNTAVRIVFFRPRLGRQTIFCLLGEKPRPPHKPPWGRERSVLAGRPVLKPQRPKYWKLVSRHPFVRKFQWYLTTLIEIDWGKGLYPKHETIALKANSNVSAVRRAQACCAHFGFVRVISGKCRHKSNYYDVCWPAGTP